MFARVFNFAQFSVRNLVVWFLMAFQAGVINVGGFLGCHRFVSHTTGFATTFGESFASGHMNAAVAAAIVPLFFLVGVMIAAYYVDRRIAAHRTPQYTLLMGSIVVLMLVAALGGEAGWFGAFDVPDGVEPSYPLLALLCLACGIQNACVTSASGAVVRTTHLTGITTDLGIGIMRLVSEGQDPRVRHHEAWASAMRVGIILFFVAGSSIGALVFIRYNYSGFYIPVVVSGGLVLLDIFDRLSRKRKALAR